jgi:cell division protein FtsX
MKHLTALLLFLSFMVPAVAQQTQEQPKTEMKLAKKKADKEKEAKEKKAQTAKQSNK